VVRTFADDEPSVGRDRNRINLIEALVRGRRLHLPKRARDCGDGNPVLSEALLVTANGIGQRSFKEIRDYAKSGIPGWRDIACAVTRQRICVVDHKRLLRRQARGEKELFAMACAQHIQTDTHVRVKETLSIKSGFSGALHSDKDYGFHRLACPGSIAARF
jgi:hypothetical protein